MESVNAEALKETGKKQNHVEEYREMLQAWRKAKAMTYAGYIIGFPSDTYESVMRDVEILKRELPLDLVEFFVLTPLPGSEDHQILVKEGAWLDPDMNKYDTEHACTKHPRMSQEEWMRTYRDAWKSFYSFEHIETIFRRCRAERRSVGKLLGQVIWFYGAIFIEGVHPLQAGILRRKARSERRPTLSPESPIRFAWGRIRDLGMTLFRLSGLVVKLYLLRRRIEQDPAGRTYRDIAITPVERKKGGLRVITPEETFKLKQERAPAEPAPSS
jgi:hypothetical protein